MPAHKISGLKRSPCAGSLVYSLSMESGETATRRHTAVSPADQEVPVSLGRGCNSEREDMEPPSAERALERHSATFELPAIRRVSGRPFAG